MCLTKKRFTLPQRALEDIVVYKLFIPDAFIGTELHNYWSEHYPKGKKFYQVGDTIESWKPIWRGIYKKAITKEGVHCKLIRKELLNEVFTIGNYCITKCIIPKGTLYYTDLNEVDIAAEKLVISEILEYKNAYLEYHYRSKPNNKNKSIKRKRKRASKGKVRS